MNLSVMQIIGAVVMVGVAVALLLAYRKYLAANSERRMLTMLESIGLDPAIVSTGGVGAIMSEVRRRCRSCASEAVCERWLKGDEPGDNAFCPNAGLFAILKKQSDPLLPRPRTDRGP
jgi:hypothetical protein